MQTFGVQVGPAKTSAMPIPKGRALTERTVDCFTDSWSLFANAGRDGSRSKMCAAFSHRTRGKPLSQLSTKWKKSGIWGGGLRATLSMSVFPKTGKGLSLSEVLEQTAPIKSLLTAANCKGIIRREKNNGRVLAPRLMEALTETIRLWRNVGEALGTPKDRIFAPRYAPKPEDIKEVIQTDQYFVARHLTWREWERLMGFPDDWTVVEED